MWVRGLLLGLCALVDSRVVDYSGAQVLRLDIDANDATMVEAYRHLRDHDFEFNVRFSNSRDIVVVSAAEDLVSSFLTQNNIPFTVAIPDMQVLIDAEDVQRSQVIAEEARLRATQPGAASDFFSTWRTLDEFDAWMESLVSTYPTLATKVTLGHSYENRTISGVRVTGKGDPATKKGIFLEGGIHAREWIAHTTVAWMLNTVLSEYSTNRAVQALVDELEWTFVPVVNVDGYVYTWTTDRMWRKTRTPNPGSPCVGVDPNRNWDNHWCEEGASTSKCSDSYCGPKAFSEKCVKAMADYIVKQGNIKGFIDFHSYSELWMRPYGYTAAKPKDWTAQEALGQEAVAAIKAVHGQVYGEGSIYEIIYPASGSSADWGYDNANVTFSYGVELRGDSFVVPATEIQPTGEEIWAAVQVLAKYVLKL